MKRNSKGQFEAKPTEEQRKRAMWQRGVANKLRELTPGLDADDANTEAKRLVDYAYTAALLEGRKVSEVLSSCLKHWEVLS